MIVHRIVWVPRFASSPQCFISMLGSSLSLAEFVIPALLLVRGVLFMWDEVVSCLQHECC